MLIELKINPAVFNPNRRGFLFPDRAVLRTAARRTRQPFSGGSQNPASPPNVSKIAPFHTMAIEPRVFAMPSQLGVRAYHVIFTAYGFWLPNDPRGSWSDFVRSWELFLAGGPATKVATRQSVAHTSHDHDARLRSKQSLTYPPIVFTGQQAQSIGNAFQHMVAKSKYQVYACSILPAHVHMVLGRHQYHAETMVRLLKAEATTELTRTGLHPFGTLRKPDGAFPSPWARKCWKVFLNDDERIVQAIGYVEKNPIKEGKLLQRWSFVVPFNPT
jgi:REP element-mobilizing transposase RayT